MIAIEPFFLSKFAQIYNVIDEKIYFRPKGLFNRAY